MVGIIDGTQIEIQAPKKYPEQFVNWKGDFSIAASLVINHHGIITLLSCHWPGSTHDSRVLQESYLQDVLDSYVLGNYYLLGDKGYACQSNLLTPYSIADTDEKI